MNEIKSLVILWFTLSTFGSAFAGTVVKKFTKGQRHLVEQDAGKLNGFTKGSKACIYGGKGKKIACGEIVMSQNEISRILVPKNRFNKIKTGMEVRSDGSSSTKSSSSSSAEIAGRNNFKAFYLFTPLPVTEFNRPSYSPPTANAEPVDSLWKVSTGSGMQEVGFGLEFEMAIASEFSLAFGARYKIYRELFVDSDYDPLDKAKFANTNMKASSIGFWTDFYVLNIPMTTDFFFKMPVGIDFEQTNLTLVSDRLSDTETDEEFNIATLKGSLTVLSLRTGAHFAFLMGPVGFSAGLNLFIPLAEASRSLSGSSDDPNGTRLNEKDQIDDLDEVIALKKSSFGAEILISTFVVF